ncbi:phytanoyl-CoA dioxygenase PhyH [Trinickia symbiotica]|uniref:Mitomycin antibiotic biosynthesis protein n=1 Tax=Trinickia symbiotica TaxID=863227 RepID=A0A2N7WPH3_9BURK|nr:phytanoyl-CoA dioxygenase family protein [Trinickia symbiotica]PMS31252.1 mitomycin antibiotic biosynthesis protein [Trinickia symbiotica]PPK41721.1 phytanoyl-CoA dioxygenase PhyH [Trinickia symbiotica]
MEPIVSAEQIEQFRQKGATVLRGVFSEHWIKTVDAGITKNLEKPSRPNAFVDGESRGFFQDSNNWRCIEEFRDFALNSPAKIIAGELMCASKINFLHDHVLVKKAGVEKRTPWHQDQPYSPVDGRDFCTMWLPTGAVSAETALEFVAESHASGKWYRPQRFTTGSLREGDDQRWEILPDVEADRDRYEILRWAMKPGDVVVFHGLTLHGAAGNSDTADRRVLSTRWTGDDARFQRRPGEMSPPPPANGAPRDGDPLDCEAFPVVWRRNAQHAR